MAKSRKSNQATVQEPDILTIDGFLGYFVDDIHKAENRACCFILGAGASFSSDVPTGAEFVDVWLNELNRRLNPNHSLKPVEQWATADSLGIPGFEYARRAEFYPQIFDRRFADRDIGFAFLEKAMEGVLPGVGYSILASILAAEKHNVVITTNFDDLVTNALLAYPEKPISPLVCGHESLTQFVRERMRRPLIAKIHRGLYFAPFNDSTSVNELAEEWKPALRALLRVYTPVVIGYGGNDGSLMGFLDSLEPGEINGQMMWCYYRDKPKPQVQDLLVRHRGALVEIDGFDELMFQLGRKLGCGSVAEAVENRHQTFLGNYRQKYAELSYKFLNAEKNPESVASAPTWWKWQQLAEQASGVEARNEIYLLGIDEFPNSPELLGKYAIFLKEEKRSYAEAEVYHRKVFDLDETLEEHRFDSSEFIRELGERSMQQAKGVKGVSSEYAAWLLKDGKIEEAQTVAAEAWEINQLVVNRQSMEIAYLRGLILLQKKKSDEEALARLKTLFEQTFPSSTSHVVNFLQPILADMGLCGENCQLYHNIAKAIQDGREVQSLDKHQRWLDVKAKSLDVPWLVPLPRNGKRESHGNPPTDGGVSKSGDLLTPPRLSRSNLLDWTAGVSNVIRFMRLFFERLSMNRKYTTCERYE